MSDDEKSNRQKRKETREAAAKLKKDAAWSLQSSDPMEKLMQLDQEARNEEVFEESEACEACTRLRQKTNDETALCEEHLAEAMGF